MPGIESAISRQKNQIEPQNLKNTVNEMKNLVFRFKSKSDRTAERIGKWKTGGKKYPEKHHRQTKR